MGADTFKQCYGAGAGRSPPFLSGAGAEIVICNAAPDLTATSPNIIPNIAAIVVDLQLPESFLGGMPVHPQERREGVVLSDTFF